MNKTEEIGMDKAMMSWFLTVYMPVIKVIDKHKIMKAFKKRTKSDLYVWVIKYWDEIKQKFGEDYSIDDMADSFLAKFGERPLSKRIWNKITGFFLKKKIEETDMNRADHEQKNA